MHGAQKPGHDAHQRVLELALHSTQRGKRAGGVGGRVLEFQDEVLDDAGFNAGVTGEAERCGSQLEERGTILGVDGC